MTLSLWSPVNGLFDFLVLVRLERSEVHYIPNIFSPNMGYSIEFNMDFWQTIFQHILTNFQRLQNLRLPLWKLPPRICLFPVTQRGRVARLLAWNSTAKRNCAGHCELFWTVVCVAERGPFWGPTNLRNWNHAAKSAPKAHRNLKNFLSASNCHMSGTITTAYRPTALMLSVFKSSEYPKHLHLLDWNPPATHVICGNKSLQFWT